MKNFEGKAYYPIDLESLPKGWTCAFVGEVCAEIQSGFASGEHNSAGKGVPHLRPMNIDRAGRLDMSVVKSVAADVDARRLRPGDVLFNNTNSSVLVGKTAAVSRDGDLAFSNHMTRLRPLRELDYEFLAQQLHYLWMGGYFLHRCSKHVNQASISTDTLALSVPMAVPPVREQRAIVESIDSYLTRIDDAVASLKRAQVKLKAYRASVLKAAVEGRLVPTEASLARAEKRDYEPADVLLNRILKARRRRWEEAELARLNTNGKTPKDDKWKAKYEEPVAPNTSTFPEVPEGWCWATLPQLGEFNRGKSKHRPRNDPRLLGGKYPFVQTGDIRKAETWLRTFDHTYSDFGLAQSRLWPAGTLCITIAANIAETAILEFDACFPDSVVGFLQDEPFLTRYVEIFLRTAQQRLDQYAPATAQKNINLDTLSKVAVPLPPLNEQRRMVEELDRLLSVGTAIDDSVLADRRRCTRLRQAVLKWAFEGKLVDQDPTDESAEKLLARIRAQRAAFSPVRKALGRRAGEAA